MLKSFRGIIPPDTYWISRGSCVSLDLILIIMTQSLPLSRTKLRHKVDMIKVNPYRSPCSAFRVTGRLPTAHVLFVFGKETGGKIVFVRCRESRRQRSGGGKEGGRARVGKATNRAIPVPDVSRLRADSSRPIVDLFWFVFLSFC